MKNNRRDIGIIILFCFVLISFLLMVFGMIILGSPGKYFDSLKDISKDKLGLNHQAVTSEHAELSDGIVLFDQAFKSFGPDQTAVKFTVLEVEKLLEIFYREINHPFYRCQRSAWNMGQQASHLQSVLFKIPFRDNPVYKTHFQGLLRC